MGTEGVERVSFKKMHVLLGGEFRYRGRTGESLAVRGTDGHPFRT